MLLAAQAPGPSRSTVTRHGAPHLLLAWVGARVCCAIRSFATLQGSRPPDVGRLRRRLLANPVFAGACASLPPDRPAVGS